MKRLYLISLLFCGAMLVSAQDGLQIAELFGGRLRQSEDATEVLLKGRKVSKYGLSLFRSITFVPSVGEQRSIEKCVRSDVRNAVDKEVNMRGGRLYYGFYSLPVRGSLRRYIFYRNNALIPDSDHRLTIIYMEGTAAPADLKRMFSK